MARTALASALLCALLLSVAPAASAGPHGEALSKCLVKSITAEEKLTLLRWSFFMFAAHPAVEKDSAITPEQRSAMSKKAAKVIERLLTQSCAAESLAASKHEGASGLQTGFALLSQRAINDLVMSPEVSAAMTECIQFIDREKLRKVVVQKED